MGLLSVRLPAIFLVVATVLASGATWSVQHWRWSAKYSELVAAHATERERQATTAQQEQAKAITATQEANDERERELAGIAAAAGSRADAVIRLYRPAVPAGRCREVPDAQHGAGEAARLLPAEGQRDPGAGGVTEWSTHELHELFDEADRVSADLRVCQARWPK